MALTVETGVGVDGADSLVSLAQVRAYASSRGLTVPADDSALEQLVRKANDYLLTLEDKFNGERVSGVQPLPWPRKHMYLFGHCLESTVIPNQVVQALSQLTFEIISVDPTPTGSGKPIVSETVGPLVTVYERTGTTGSSPTFPAVMAFLAPLLRNGGQLTVDRG